MSRPAAPDALQCSLRSPRAGCCCPPSARLDGAQRLAHLACAPPPPSVSPSSRRARRRRRSRQSALCAAALAGGVGMMGGLADWLSARQTILTLSAILSTCVHALPLAQAITSARSSAAAASARLGGLAAINALGAAAGSIHPATLGGPHAARRRGIVRDRRARPLLGYARLQAIYDSPPYTQRRRLPRPLEVLPRGRRACRRGANPNPNSNPNPGTTARSTSLPTKAARCLLARQSCRSRRRWAWAPSSCRAPHAPTPSRSPAPSPASSPGVGTILAEAGRGVALRSIQPRPSARRHTTAIAAGGAGAPNV